MPASIRLISAAVGTTGPFGPVQTAKTDVVTETARIRRRPTAKDCTLSVYPLRRRVTSGRRGPGQRILHPDIASHLGDRNVTDLTGSVECV